MPEYKYPGYGPTNENWLTPRAKTKGGYHGGSDNPAKPGTPVYAQYDGEIFRTGKIDGYGMSVVVKSRAPDGTVFYQLYGHLGPDPLPAQTRRCHRCASRLRRPGILARSRRRGRSAGLVSLRLHRGQRRFLGLALLFPGIWSLVQARDCRRLRSFRSMRCSHPIAIAHWIDGPRCGETRRRSGRVFPPVRRPRRVRPIQNKRLPADYSA